MTIDTDRVSARYRTRAVDLKARKLLVTNYRGTAQEKDLTEPANCEGFGRIRHFRRRASTGWPENPLPSVPATRALGIEGPDVFRAQVFQNAVCNWRCWYCYVPFDLLSADRKHSEWLGAADLVDLYLAEPDPPRMIDLSGGQPDLVPEWVPWMMEELRERGLDRDVYLWSDDNLSNDYFWTELTDRDRELIATYPVYGRVCCFKGFNSESFAFNTLADPAIFDRQFELFRRLLSLGIDLYAYVTLTAPTAQDLEDDMRRFVDRLQAIDERLPLRTIPLEILVYSTVIPRVTAAHEEALRIQHRAVEVWQREVEARFTGADRAIPIGDVAVGARVRT